MRNKRFAFLIAMLLVLCNVIFVPSNAIAEDNYSRVQDMVQLYLKGEISADDITDRYIVIEEDGTLTPKIQSIAKKDVDKYITKDRVGFFSARKHSVTKIEPDYIRYIHKEGLSWGYNSIKVDHVYEHLNLNSTNEVIVAVIDTGVDINHEFFSGRIVPGINTVDNSSDVTDSAGHGTHVAGIVADTTPNNVKIMPIRVTDESGLAYDSAISQGIIHAVDNGVSIVNISMGGPGYSETLLSSLQYAQQNDVLVVVSAGNDSSDTKYFLPAGYNEPLVVSALDKIDKFANFSNYGQTVDLSAPGVSINSTHPNNSYGLRSGTSMSSPYVAGVAALLKLEDPTRTVDDLEYLLKFYSKDLGEEGKDPYYGVGKVSLEGYVVNNENIDDLILISPKEDSVIFNELNLRFKVIGYEGTEFKFYLNGDLVETTTFPSDGDYELIFNTENLAGKTINVEVTGNDNPINTFTFRKNNYNTFIEVQDKDGVRQDRFTSKIYYLRDINGTSEIVGESLTYQTYDGQLELNLPYDKLSYDYDKIVLVTYNVEDLNTPIYMEELVGPNTYSLTPNNYKKLKVTTDISKDSGKQLVLKPDLILKLGNKVLKPFNISDYWGITQGEEFNVYLPKTDSGLLFKSKDFSAYLDYTEDVDKIVNISESELGEAMFDYRNFAGSFELYNIDEVNFELSRNNMNNNQYRQGLLFGEYVVLNEMSVNGQYNYTYNEFKIDSQNPQHIVRLSTTFTDNFELNTDTSSSVLNGTLEMKDEFNNIFIEGFKLPHTKGKDNTEMRISLKNIDTGTVSTTKIKMDNTFYFNDIPNGKYELYTQFEREGLQFNHTILNVEVRDNQFVEDSGIQEPYSEYENIDTVKEIGSTKIWEILYNREFSSDEIKSIEVVTKEGELQNTLLSHRGVNGKTYIKLIDGYKSNTEYYILIELINGNKFKSSFKYL